MIIILSPGLLWASIAEDRRFEQLTGRTPGKQIEQADKRTKQLGTKPKVEKKPEISATAKDTKDTELKEQIYKLTLEIMKINKEIEKLKEKGKTP